MISIIRNLFNRGPDEYRVIRTGRNENRKIIKGGLHEKPDPETWLAEHPDLPAGTYRCQAVTDNKFGKVAWVRRVGEPEKVREANEVREELEELKSALVAERSKSRQPAGDFEERLKQATFEAVLEGEMDVNAARQLAALSAEFDGGGKDGLADAVDDPKDLGEIGGRAVLQLLDDPAQVEQFSKSMGGAASGFLDGLEKAPNDAAGAAEVEDDDGDRQSRIGEIDAGPETMEELGQDIDLGLDEEETGAETEPEIDDEPAVEDAPEEPAVADGGDETDDDVPSEEEVADAL